MNCNIFVLIIYCFSTRPIWSQVFLSMSNKQNVDPNINISHGKDNYNYNDDDYICVPYYNCDPDSDTIIRNGTFDGAGVIDIRLGINKCDHYMDVKCRKPTNYETVTTKQPIMETIPITQKPILRSCGIRNVNGVDFKITGNTDNESEFGEFPWMVAILRRQWNNNNFEITVQCGGSIIHSSVVITGAHCVYELNPRDIVVRAGEWDTQTTKERLPYQQRNVTSVRIHESFKPMTLYNDIALLILESPLIFDQHIAPICLPTFKKILTENNCLASGWGKNNFGKAGQYQVILKKIQLPLVSYEQCQNDLRSTRLGQYFSLHQSFICAGGVPGQDTCTGDGGSPLVCSFTNEDNVYYQAGIVAWGIGCGNNVPGVYVNVAMFKNWIDQQMISINLNTNSYTLQQIGP